MGENEKQRWALLVAYLGEGFSGWQSQPVDRTVQDLLSEALETLHSGEAIKLEGSGRTDAGVHAIGQVAHFDAPSASTLSAYEYPLALNAHLPREIRILQAAPVSSEFHARYSALTKTYRYRIYRGVILPPQEEGRCYHLRNLPDLTLLKKQLAMLQGTHDFACFTAKRARDLTPEKSTIREIFSADLTEKPCPLISNNQVYEIEFRGGGFLYKMVRLMVGTALRVATNKLPLEEFEKMLAQPTEPTSSHCAPAEGLTLMSVEYEHDPFSQT